MALDTFDPGAEGSIYHLSFIVASLIGVKTDEQPLVSLVDGYNLPMAITNSANCPVADCLVDLGPNCELRFSCSSSRLINLPSQVLLP